MTGNGQYQHCKDTCRPTSGAGGSHFAEMFVITRPARSHYNLRRDLEALAYSGHGWARDALDRRRSAGGLYVSAGGFTDHFRRATRESRILLIDLDGLYDYE